MEPAETPEAKETPNEREDCPRISRRNLCACLLYRVVVGGRDLIGSGVPADQLVKASVKRIHLELRPPAKSRNQLVAPQFHIGIDGGPREPDGNFPSLQRTGVHLAGHLPSDRIIDEKGIVSSHEHPTRQPLPTYR